MLIGAKNPHTGFNSLSPLTLNLVMYSKHKTEQNRHKNRASNETPTWTELVSAQIFMCQAFISVELLQNTCYFPLFSTKQHTATVLKVYKNNFRIGNLKSSGLHIFFFALANKH